MTETTLLITEIQSQCNIISDLLKCIKPTVLMEHRIMLNTFLTCLWSQDSNLLYSCMICNDDSGGIIIRWSEYRIFCEISDRECYISYVPLVIHTLNVEYKIFKSNEMEMAVKNVLKLINGQREESNEHCGI